MRGILEGLAYMHSKSIVHKNIKSSSILIKAEENILVPKLSNFDINNPVEKEQTSKGTAINQSQRITSQKLL
jgi:serine/threonine protein kinase